jgi:hypothetical protein
MARTTVSVACPLIVAIGVALPATIVAAAPSRAEMDRAVRALEADHDSATSAVRALRDGGAPAALAIRDAWPSLSTVAQKRAIGALRSLAEDQEAALEVLTTAARSEDDAIRRLALDALSRTPGRGLEGLAALIADPKVGDRAAALFARQDPDGAIPILLMEMSVPGGADRRSLREALVVAVQRATAPELALQAWLESEPPAAAMASASLGLSTLDVHPEVLGSLVAHALIEATDFSTTWRLLESAGAAGPSAAIDAWVESKLNEPGPWMVRAAAVDAVAARGLRDKARPSLADPYPRVRLRAALALSGDAHTMIDRAALARTDIWPMVRAAAVMSLRGEGDALPVVIAAVDDSMSVVRKAAIEVLTATPHDEGWDRIHRRLLASQEWPGVTAAAIEYVVAHCRTDAAESLFRVVMRAAPSNARTDDLNNAARAIEALRVLGTPEARSVIEQLRGTTDVPPTLKMALDAAAPRNSECPASKP